MRRKVTFHLEGCLMKNDNQRQIKLCNTVVLRCVDNFCSAEKLSSMITKPSQQYRNVQFTRSIRGPQNSDREDASAGVSQDTKIEPGRSSRNAEAGQS
jgi:hypothetical protein